MRVYSIGYERRSIVEFCTALKEAGVDVILDVRERAWSHRPEYRKKALSTALAEAGIDYLHLKAAGNPFRPRKGQDIDAEQCLRMYARHLKESPEVLDEIQKLVRKRKVALFCYEGHRDRCHRGVIFDELASRAARIKIVDL